MKKTSNVLKLSTQVKSVRWERVNPYTFLLDGIDFNKLKQKAMEVIFMQKHANEDIRYMSYRIPYRLIAEKLGITTGAYMNMLIKPLKKEKHDQIVGIIEELKEEIENGTIR